MMINFPFVIADYFYLALYKCQSLQIIIISHVGIAWKSIYAEDILEILAGMDGGAQHFASNASTPSTLS